MHSIFLVYLKTIAKTMKDNRLYSLRATWHVARMYNEEASKYDASMATGLLY
jgi:hypothetical protein